MCRHSHPSFTSLFQRRQTLKKENAVRTTPTLPGLPLPPSQPRGEAAPGEANPVPDREVRKDLQQDQVRQVRKSRHDAADTHCHFWERNSVIRPGSASGGSGGSGARAGRGPRPPVAGREFQLSFRGAVVEPLPGIRTGHGGRAFPTTTKLGRPCGGGDARGAWLRAGRAGRALGR